MNETNSEVLGSHGEWIPHKQESKEVNQSFIEQASCCGGNQCNESAIETGGSQDSQDLQEELQEEWFFLIYHLHMQPSEIDKMSPNTRKWLISRFIEQKQAEKELMNQMRRSSGVITPDILKEIESTRNY